MDGIGWLLIVGCLCLALDGWCLVVDGGWWWLEKAFHVERGR